MILALDIGGTNIRLALFKNKPVPDLSRIREQLLKLAVIRVRNVYTEDLEAIRNQLVEFLAGIPENAEGIRIEAAAVAIAGSLQKDGSGLLNSVNLKDWERHDLRADLESICGCNVTLANDTYCAALAEAGCLRDKQDFWYVNWGTGIGGCLVEAGTAWKIRPSEIGHMAIAASGRVCRCGQLDCWDAYVSGRALNADYARPLQELNDREWRQALDTFVIGLKNLYLAVPVKVIILNGGVITHHRELLPLLEKKFRDSIHIVSPDAEIRPAKLGDLAGLAGAWSLATGK